MAWWKVKEPLIYSVSWFDTLSVRPECRLPFVPSRCNAPHRGKRGVLKAQTASTHHKRNESAIPFIDSANKHYHRHTRESGYPVARNAHRCCCLTGFRHKAGMTTCIVLAGRINNMTCREKIPVLFGSFYLGSGTSFALACNTSSTALDLPRFAWYCVNLVRMCYPVKFANSPFVVCDAVATPAPALFLPGT
jgi:hypothetical protein